MKRLVVTQDIINAWESWLVTVPDECPTAEEERNTWLRQNPEKIEWEMELDSGFEASEITESETL